MAFGQGVKAANPEEPDFSLLSKICKSMKKTFPYNILSVVQSLTGVPGFDVSLSGLRVSGANFFLFSVLLAEGVLVATSGLGVFGVKSPKMGVICFVIFQICCKRNLDFTYVIAKLLSHLPDWLNAGGGIGVFRT